MGWTRGEGIWSVIGGVLVTQRCYLFAWSAGLSGLLFSPIFFPTRMVSCCSCSCRWGRQFGGFLEGIRIGFAAVLSGFLFLALVMGLPVPFSLSQALPCLSLLPCANSPKAKDLYWTLEPGPCLDCIKILSFFILSSSHQFLDVYMEH